VTVRLTTVAALAIVWGTRALAGWTAQATQWYQQRVSEIVGVAIEPVELVGAG